MRRFRRGRTAATCLAAAFAVSPAGAGLAEQEIAFHTRRDGKFEIYLRCTDGRELNLTNDPAQDYGASWSPDGSRLAFATSRDGNEEIYLLDLATGGIENLTRHPATDTQPAWSPDGARIAFLSERDAPTAGDPATDPLDARELYVLELATREVRRVTRNSRYEESPSWTPDGSALVLCRTAPEQSGKPARCDLWSVKLDGGEKALTSREGFNSGADASRPGGPILFHGREAGWHDLFALDPAKGTVKRLTADEREDWQPTWSHDGAEIVWAAGHRPNEYDIWAMRADGSNARALVTASGRDEYPVPRPKGAAGGPCAVAAKAPAPRS